MSVELTDLPEPVLAQFDRLPLPMQMRVVARVLERLGEKADREHWWSPGSWRYYAEQFEREDVAAACRGFQWVGQTWDSCAGCGQPYWEHNHIEKADSGPFDEAPSEYLPISEKSKQRMKRFYDEPANSGKMPSPLRTT